MAGAPHLLVTLGLAALAAGSPPASQVDSFLQDAKSHPVSKVMTLLKDMTIQLDKEAKEDEEVYENLGCWCETNDREKTKSIAEGEQRLTALTNAIEEYTGESARLNTEISNLNKEINKGQQALDTATVLRTKQLAEFNEEEKDMLQSINSLKAAVISLSKHNAAAGLIQMPDDESMDMMVAVKHELNSHQEELKGIITPRQHRALQAFAASPEQYLSAKPEAGLLEQHASAPQGGQSAEIFGILQQMKESFETNLAASQAEETKNVKAYQDLKLSKEGELAAIKDQSETKSAQLGEAEDRKASSKQDSLDTSATLAADQKFLADVKTKCSATDAEYAMRVKTRQMETEAIAKALEFLTSDDAHELFGRTFNPTLLQRASTGSAKRVNVQKLLMRVAEESNDPRLSQIAIRVRMDVFDKVKATMTDMIDKLHKEKDDEILHKDFCVDEFNKNSRDTEDNERDKADFTAKIEDLKAALDVLNKEIQTLKDEVAELQTQLKRISENREIANKDFNLQVADSRATQKLIGAALGVLKGFYERSALSQVGAKQPAGFKKYEKNKNSGGVMGMMAGIITDAKEQEAEAIYAEQQTQAEYEAFVMESNRSIKDRMKNLTNKNQVKAKTERAKTENEVNLDETQTALDGLYEESHTLHIDCDYLLKNFDIRATARDAEVEALKEGIAMFSGASFSSLAQNYLSPL